MEKLSKDTERIMNELFGGDSIISLATTVDNIPYVRNVDAFYLDGSFYVLTYGLSRKMVQSEKIPLSPYRGNGLQHTGKVLI